MKFVYLAAAILLSSSAFAEVKTESVEYKVGETTFKGHLAYDAATEGKAPGVLVVHEWWGIGEHAKKSAERLAELGYVALAVDMYGDGKLTDKVPEAQKWSSELKGNPAVAKERFEAGMKFLQAHERVNPDLIGATGYCFGGTVVLEMARAGVPLKGIVSFHGGLRTGWPEGERTITSGVLVCHGADDPFVKDEEVATFVNEMRTAKADWQLISYGGAVHSFTNPEVDKVGLSGAKYDKKADARSWDDMRQFFEEVLK